MDTCFLFSKNISADGCMFLKLSQEGSIVLAPTFLSLEDIRLQQNDCKTIVVESSESTSMLDLALAWLPERKARLALPYSLEDKVAQPIEELHFAFDKYRYHNKHYLVTVISKYRMQYLMGILAEYAIDYELITTDWFALEAEELVVTDSLLLVNVEAFKGALANQLALNFIKKSPQYQTLIFQDCTLPVDTTLAKGPEHSLVWIARRLQHNKPLNLCQGALQHNSGTEWIHKGYALAGIMAGAWLFSILLFKGLSLYSIHKQTAKIDQQIAGVYHQFFPDAKQIINPKFRINQLLQGSDSEAQAHFWFLLNQFAKSMEGSSLHVDQMRFQNTTLSVTLTSSDFPSLEQLENSLKKAQVKVRQTQASTHNQQVVATLELT